MQEDTFYQIRRKLHQHPELSGHEAQTARFVEDKLQAFNPTKIIRHVGGHGLLVEYFFSEDGPTVLFRADIDAVAVQEPEEISHHSQTPGVAHKCGHDGHTTILLRFARMLSEHPLTKGRILLLFQPAEENGSGSKAVLDTKVLDYYQKKFRYVLVDEYQDTNHLQYLLTGLLAGGHRNLCVVGDDDQSIYRFRGANIENILNFEKQYKDARVIRLEQNYRSTQHILDAANAVIKNNEGRKGKTLWTDNGSGDVVTVKTNFNEGDEANFVAGDILMGVNRGRNFRDTAILYRMNAQSNALEYALKRNAIPYKVVGGMKFFDRAEIKDMLAYLCVLNNPMDDLRLRRIINTPARGIGATTMDKVAELAAEQGASLYEIIRNADLFPTLKTAAGKLTKFADLIDGLRRAGGTLALPEFYDEVLNQTGYVRALEEKKDMESRGRIENVQELKSNILGFLEQDPEDATLSGFLNEIALYTDLDSVEADDNCVTMMTIHSAKGLEFPVVYVVGMEEGIFPGTASMYDEEELEEERRLCYVAMTRAREKLVMTNARQRMLYGRTSANKSSRFLDEIPAEDMRWESKPEPKFGTYDEDGFGGSRWGDDFGGGSFGGSSYSGSSGRSGGYVSGGVHTYKSTKPAAQALRTSSRAN